MAMTVEQIEKEALALPSKAFHPEALQEYEEAGCGT